MLRLHTVTPVSTAVTAFPALVTKRSHLSSHGSWRHIWFSGISFQSHSPFRLLVTAINLTENTMPRTGMPEVYMCPTLMLAGCL